MWPLDRRDEEHTLTLTHLERANTCCSTRTTPDYLQLRYPKKPAQSHLCQVAVPRSHEELHELQFGEGFPQRESMAPQLTV